ncbi:DUF6279 family lipoprotein [Vibrio sp. ABG19]|uniref:DUF6279 family lipoprotein n=1 Tax=Vibrio sp. ABG19 TaxID=2817385 RepID=UPI00249E7F9A|nr:DUF6279 family lipoprotein [Vibrio sp. ABG19]WGY47162.1 hypothetical protein J0X00_20560 [Vibrio sp. ABG19]
MTKVKTLFLLIAAFMVCSCSTTTFVYNNVDWFIEFYLDDYVELDSKQEEILVKSVNKLRSWHRTTELSKYKTDLTLFTEQLKEQHLNRDQWLDIFSKSKRHIYNFRDEVAPEAIKLIQQLSDDQINQVLVLWSENDHEEFEEFTQLGAEEEIEVRQEKIKEALERNIGDLSSQQESIVYRYSLRIESTFVEENAYSKKLRTALEQLLDNRNTDEFSNKFTFLIKNLDSFKSESLLNAKQTNEYVYAELLSELNASLSKKQRDNLLKKLKSHIETLDSLINSF